MIYQDYNVRAVGLVDENGIIYKEPIYRKYAEQVKLLAQNESEYFTVINKPSGRSDEKEDIVVLFSDEYHIVINYMGLCITDVKSIEISSDEDTPIVIMSGEDEFAESHGISCPDAFEDGNLGDYCVKLEFDFEEDIKELDDRISVFFKMVVIKTPDKIRDMKYPCFLTEINSGTSFINGQGITLSAILSPLMIDPVPITAFGISDESYIIYKKISYLCKVYEPMFKYFQYCNNIIVYDKEKKMLNIKHIFVNIDMKHIGITDEFVNKTSRVVVEPNENNPNIFQYYDLVNSPSLLYEILHDTKNLENIVMVGNAPIIGRDTFYNMDEESISDEIREEVNKIFDELDKEAKALDMNSLTGFKFSEIVNNRYDNENIFSNILELLDSDEGVIVYNPNEYTNDFHLIFISK